LILNDAAFELSALLVDSKFQNSIIREYIWGGVHRSLRHLVPAPMWDQASDLMRDEEAERWREGIVLRKRMDKLETTLLCSGMSSFIHPTSSRS
jgi:hypothetical protein